MKFEYTLAELSTAITALEQVYGKVSVLDPYLGTVLDPATLQPTDKAEELTALDETGRGVQLAQADDGPELVLYQGIQADARPCVLAFHCCMPHNLQSSAGAENSFNRVLAQMQEELRRDYLTGVYNARYLDTEYRRYAEPQAQAGKPVGVVMARVNEYWSLRQNESANAADWLPEHGRRYPAAVCRYRRQGRRAGPFGRRPVRRGNGGHPRRPGGPQTAGRAGQFPPGVQHQPVPPRQLYRAAGQRRMGRDPGLGHDVLSGPAAPVILWHKKHPPCVHTMVDRPPRTQGGFCYANR